MDDDIELPASSILDAAPDGMVVVDERGRIRVANAAMVTLFGYEPVELIDRLVEVLVPEEARDVHLRERAEFGRHPARRPMGAATRLHGRRRDGTVFPVHISLSPLETPSGLMTIAAIRDMSPWVKAEQELAEANRRRAIAEDQERIARDLHDTVIQELFAVGMSLQAVHTDVDSPRAAERIERAVDALDETIRQVRSTIFGLHASNRHGGLGAELDEIIRGLTPSLGFVPRLDLRGAIDTLVPMEIAVHVVPMVREGLTNVARHARASAAEVCVDARDGTVRVWVRDDGVGIPDGSRRASGLANLARRAEELGGTLRIGPGARGGTVLEWVVPLPAAAS